MISQQHSELAESAFARLSGSLKTVEGLESPKLPRLFTKQEWQGRTKLSFWELRRTIPWRPNELRAVDNALKKYSEARVQYERLAETNQQKLQKLTDSVAAIDNGRWQRKLNGLLASKGRELKAYKRALEAAGGVDNRFDHWLNTRDFHFRGLQKSSRAVHDLVEQFSPFNLMGSAAQLESQLESRRSKLTEAIDSYRNARRELKSDNWAALRRAARSLLRLDFVGAMMDLRSSDAPNSLLQTPSQLRGGLAPTHQLPAGPPPVPPRPRAPSPHRRPGAPHRQTLLEVSARPHTRSVPGHVSH